MPAQPDRGAREVAESQISDALARGDAHSAVAALWRAYGAEVFGWLVSVHGPVEAADICGALGVTLVRAMKSFRGESSARTWLYQVARNEARQHRRAELRRRRVLTPLYDHPSAEQRADAVSSGRRGALERLRTGLSEADRSLLVLRIDRGLSYREIAVIMLEPSDAEAVERGAARLRQRVREVRERLRSLSMESE